MKTSKQTRPCIFLEDTREEIKNLSRREILNRAIGGVRTSVYGSNSDFTIFRTYYIAEVMGDKQFYKKASEMSLTFKKGKFFGNFTDELLIAIVQVFKLDWTKENWVRRLLAHNKILWAQIIQGKITNPEQLAKKYSKLYFKGVYSYKSLKLYFTEYFRVGSLWDIYYYTSNPNLWIAKLSYYGYNEDGGCIDVWRDVLHYAKIENSKVNPSWSAKRLSDEHQKQIERDNLSLINTYSDEKIATPFERDGLQLILDERDAFIEGTVMHNCVHSCYWNRIANGNYLIAKGVVDGVKIDVGISLCYSDDGDALQLNQVHSIYNGIVSQEIKQYCLDWIDAHHQDLLGVLNEIRKPELPKRKASLNDLDALAALRARLRGDMPAPEEIDLPF